MKHIVKRSLALLMAFIMCISLLPMISITTDAAEFEYTYDASGQYIYNWGARGDTATALSPNAEAFYQSATYDALSAYPGGAGVSDAPSSALYTALQTLMKNAHDYETSYDATRNLYQYTDCQNSGNPNTISSFYSGAAIGPDWDGGSTWNREHTWPNSKGDASGNGENDIMMLRPAASSENSSRGNKAYGASTGFYNPNTASDGQYDLRGDVARIMLYVYVRWGNTGAMWGSDGVIESLELLLEWMEADPVDTWELGRNDSVESITGTRNVFVDYPEFAFLLFGADMPTDMTTPSGEAKNAVNCQHNYQAGQTVAPTCTEEGYTVYTCDLCGKSYKGDPVAAAGHTYADGKCTVCQADEVLVPVTVTQPAAGTAYKLGLHSLAKDTAFFFKGTMNGYYGATDSTYANGVDVYLEETTDGYYLYFLDADNARQYINLVESGTHLNFTFATAAGSVFTWDAEKAALWTTVGTEQCYMGTYGDYVTIGVLKASTMTGSEYLAQLYTLGSSSDVAACQHSYESVVTPPTCTAEGYTTYTCTLCSKSYTSDTVSATGHTYADGSCTACGIAAPAGNFATITFDTTDKRTEFSTSKQVWEENGITVTNEKGSSTTDVADYADPVRFYKNSTLTIAYPGMTKIEVACNSSTYATYLSSSVTDGTVSTDGKTVTITLSAAADTYSVVLSGGQVRVDSITVYAEERAECAHSNIRILEAVPATCTESGLTEGSQCLDCGATVTAQTEIPATGHNYVGGTCTNCGATEPTTPVGGWVKVDLADIAASDTIAITMIKDGTTWALFNGNGTGSAPTAVVVTVNGDVMTCDAGETISWNIVNDNGALTIYVAGSTEAWLYTTDKNNGVRVGTNANKTWVLDSASGYLKHEATERYMGVYTTNPDWRAYSSTTTNIVDQTLTFWKLNTGSDVTPEPEKPDLPTSYEDFGVPATPAFYVFCEDNHSNEGTWSPTFVPGYSTCTEVVLNADGVWESQLTFRIRACVEEVALVQAYPGHMMAVEFPEEATFTIVWNAETQLWQYTEDHIPLFYAVKSVPAACEHTNTTVEGAAPATCTAAGHTGKTVCTDCGEVVSEGETIPATGHSMTFTLVQAPTEKEAGYLTGACADCTETDEVVLSALNSQNYDCEILTAPAGETGGTARYTWKETTYGAYSFEVSFRYGDANGDGKVGLLDLLLMRQYIVNCDPITNVSTVAACVGIDANCDGKVGLLDLLLIRQYIANSDPVSGESSTVLGPQ